MVLQNDTTCMLYKGSIVIIIGTRTIFAIFKIVLRLLVWISTFKIKVIWWLSIRKKKEW